MDISIGIPPSPRAPELAALAEELGYARLWMYDSAALYEDVWIHLALAAERTRRIGLGTAVLVPSLRHVMATASAIATVERLAPGRLVCGFGTGFTARLVLGRRALPWASLRRYLEQLRGLLRGDVVDIEGRPCQMIHHPGLALPRPIEVPFVLSAFGPKGRTIAAELGVPLMGVAPPAEPGAPYVQLVNGTVLEPGESPGSERVVEAAGAWQAVMAHGLWETGGAAVDALPGGAAWRAAVEAERPEGERHLAVHEGHCTHVTGRDRVLLEGVGDAVPWAGWVGEAAALRARADAAAAAGTTELLYTPAGPDLEREMRAFAGALL